jgi:hypothetical protein
MNTPDFKKNKAGPIDPALFFVAMAAFFIKKVKQLAVLAASLNAVYPSRR